MKRMIAIVLAGCLTAVRPGSIVPSPESKPCCYRQNLIAGRETCLPDRQAWDSRLTDFNKQALAPEAAAAFRPPRKRGKTPPVGAVIAEQTAGPQRGVFAGRDGNSTLAHMPARQDPARRQQFDQAMVHPLEAAARALGHRDVIVGIAFYKETHNIRSLVEKVKAGLEEWTRKKRASFRTAVVVLAEPIDEPPGKNDPLPIAVLPENKLTDPAAFYKFTKARGFKGKVWSERALLQLGQLCGSHVMTMDGDIRNEAIGDWPRIVLEPLLAGEAKVSIVSTVRGWEADDGFLHAWDWLLMGAVHGLSLYGRHSGETGFAHGVLQEALDFPEIKHDGAYTLGGQAALAFPHHVQQVWLDAKEHDPVDPEMLLDKRMPYLVRNIFDEILVWREAGKLSGVPLDPARTPIRGIFPGGLSFSSLYSGTYTERIRANLHKKRPEYEALWKAVLPAEIVAALSRMVEGASQDFSPEQWAVATQLFLERYAETPERDGNERAHLAEAYALVWQAAIMGYLSRTREMSFGQAQRVLVEEYRPVFRDHLAFPSREKISLFGQVLSRAASFGSLVPAPWLGKKSQTFPLLSPMLAVAAVFLFVWWIVTWEKEDDPEASRRDDSPPAWAKLFKPFDGTISYKGLLFVLGAVAFACLLHPKDFFNPWFLPLAAYAAAVVLMMALIKPAAFLQEHLTIQLARRGWPRIRRIIVQELWRDASDAIERPTPLWDVRRKAIDRLEAIFEWPIFLTRLNQYRQDWDNFPADPDLSFYVRLSLERARFTHVGLEKLTLRMDQETGQALLRMEKAIQHADRGELEEAADQLVRLQWDVRLDAIFVPSAIWKTLNAWSRVDPTAREAIARTISLFENLGFALPAKLETVSAAATETFDEEYARWERIARESDDSVIWELAERHMLRMMESKRNRQRAERQAA